MKSFSKKILLFIFFTICLTDIYSQGIGIGTTSPDGSAKLDIFSNSQGVLLPRLTSAQRDAIVNPAEGLQIFNIETKCYNFYKNNNWFELCGTCIPPASPSLGNNGPLCSGDTLKLTATNIAGATYSWSGPNGFTSSLQNPRIPNADTLFSGKYSVVLSAKNCSSNPVFTNVSINPYPDASFSFAPLIPDSAQSVTFTPSTNWASYSWTFQNGNPTTSTSQNPAAIWNAKGTYKVSLTISINGCSATYSDTVHIKRCIGSQAFAVNGSGNSGSMQTFVVPGCVNSITVEAWGAQGGNNGATGGLGAYMNGTFIVTPGDVLLVGVGQQPAQCCSGAGGGGSSGVYNSTTSQHLILAGGGGGGGASSSVSSLVTKDAVTSTSGQNTYGCGSSTLIASGGTGGSGGQGATNPCGDWPKGGGGGGINSNGGVGGAGGGSAFSVNGGSGGYGTNGSVGGWGYTGGGGAEYGGGGGGGYSGGAGGSSSNGYTSGGGGGSYNSGTNPSSSAGVQTGDGKILISW